MVVASNAVSDPRTMMIHAHDTLVADGAVVSTGWSEHVALEAVAPLDQVQIVHMEFLVHQLLDLVPIIIRHIVDPSLLFRHAFDIVSKGESS